MRTLVLMRGAPGCGKSTFIAEHGLSEYTIETDEIRLLIQSPIMTIDGEMQISQENNKQVWETLFNILESRMKNGDFTVIDATHTNNLTKYKELIQRYKYRAFVVDFSDLPIEECKKRNKLRAQYKQVSDSVIDKMYAQMKSQKIPSGFEILKPEQWQDMFIKPMVVNYNRIHFIGDIHGCYTILKKCLQEFYDNDLYVFCGDYIDRGLENAEILKFLYEISSKSNVCLLERKS